MTMAMRTTDVTTVRTVRMPRGTAARTLPMDEGVRSLIGDGYRHEAIGSLQALALAVVASLLVSGLLWTVL
ncbi:hypothetical protein [Methylobacterium haplocladii]|uniref:Uncharacterized protein n=1 Tax=Methylobacterium haplocladii TaxID=1176176 RepID=A0A512IPG6_9HYPH|nr:hypothetical protein [Methylobacterium haplocladii]GEO99570.1 hypothetical protein MHA02_19580 [Methylobacterium haplocladii]GJD85862.1 hypothetical protein HPGCJGGD_3756 [Methylobacterium haplocladii]GLS58546.1 hypothetical protein GCM10007887_12100 [Methylobacterium haplocladii]